MVPSRPRPQGPNDPSPPIYASPAPVPSDRASVNFFSEAISLIVLISIALFVIGLFISL